MGSGKSILVIGAGGATGRQVVRQALDRGWNVRPGDRGVDSLDLPDGAEPREIDLLGGDLAPHLAGIDAVVSTVGLGLSPQTVLDPPPLYSDGARRLTDAMRKASVSRLLVTSASFVERRNRGPLWFRGAAMPLLDRIYRQMAEMEDILRGQPDIDWTAVRPGWLMEGPLTRDYVVTKDVIPKDLIRTRRADLARFVLELVETGGWTRQTPAVARPEADARSGPIALWRQAMPSD